MELVARISKLFKPPPKIGTTKWADTYRGLNQKSSAISGKYNSSITPYIRGIHETLDDPSVTKIVCMKSAQVAWTDGVLNNYIAKTIDVDPCPIIVMFAKEQAAKEYESEKFMPMVEATPQLKSRMPAIEKRRDKDNRWSYKGFAGGFLKLVGSNSPSSVKSVPARIVAVEEPDDCATDLDGQGDTITLLEERTKTFKNKKVIFGGTPTVKGLSRIEQAYLQSDQRKFYVPCHLCGEAHVLSFDNLGWEESSKVKHDIYGFIDPNSAYYACPHCGGKWNNLEKNRNVQQAEKLGYGWKAHAQFFGTAGFQLNELYSPFSGSSLKELLIKYLVAKYWMDQGDDTKYKSFVNNSKGEPYELEMEYPTAEDLRAKAEDYPEFSVNPAAFILTAGVDVQGDRFAVRIDAWGANEESWLVYWGEVNGQTSAYGHGAWDELEMLLSREFDGLKISAVSIDCSDGNTSDAVYQFVRNFKGVKLVMAVKGSSSDDGTREIFTPPRHADYRPDRKTTKADKYGVKVYLVGTMKAKDLILGSGKATGRIKLKTGAVMHNYKDVRYDYFAQMVESEIKVPSKLGRGKMVYQKRAGVRNEALDTTVYSLHAARALRVHLIKSEKAAELVKSRMKSTNEIVEEPKKKGRYGTGGWRG